MDADVNDTTRVFEARAASRIGDVPSGPEPEECGSS